MQNMNNNLNFYQTSTEATAPYNFVTLPSKMVPAPMSEVNTNGSLKDNYLAYVSENGKYSGTILYSVENLTPIYIGDNEKFFSPVGKPCIPGSTIRGMIKNYLKIISCGTMRADENEDITNKHLYFRDIASRCKELKNYYKSRIMISKKVMINNVEKERLDANTLAGFLAREKNKYYIYPADKQTKMYPRQKDKNENDIFDYKIRRDGEFELDKYGDKIKKFRYIVSADQPSVIWYKDGADLHSGDIRGKGHYSYISHPDWNNRVEVPQEVIDDYTADSLGKINFLKQKNFSGHHSEIALGKHFDLLLPCFYMEKDGVVENFGFTKFYRIPYKKSIGDHIPAELQKKESADFADMIFGRKDIWSSRVFVEDAELIKHAIQLPTEMSHNLMGPRPTSFQLYLQQKNGLKHWDDNTTIRGYKLYWHKNITNKEWQHGEKEKIVKDAPKISPLDKNAKFDGKIRFNNLSKEELGALLAVFDLGRKGVFKLGMGKPLGMGSVKLSCEVMLTDTKKRYGCLFNETGWEQGQNKIEPEQYVASFKNYMEEKTASLKINNEYKHILSELEIMMSWENTKIANWQDKTAYMPIGIKTDRRYADRKVLGTPEQFVNKPKKKGGK